MPQLCLEVVNKHKYNTESRKIYIESGGISAKIMGRFFSSFYISEFPTFNCKYIYYNQNIYFIFYNHNNNLTIK